MRVTMVVLGETLPDWDEDQSVRALCQTVLASGSVHHNVSILINGGNGVLRLSK